MLRANRLHPLIDDVIGFDALPNGLLKLANRQTMGRVIFDPNR